MNKKQVMMMVYCMAVVTAAMSFNPPSHSKVIIQFSNYVGDDKLVLDSVTYKNALGQPFTVSMFKYYISNIHLKTNSGSEYVCRDGYFLVNEDDVNSKQIVLNDVPNGNYTSLSFTLGVDSLHNCSGAQTGVLDPINGMFWAWNSGYIFLKFEGKSLASHSSGNELAFHIGGYKQPNNCIRTITLNLKNNEVSIAKDNTLVIVIKTDISELFKNPVSVDFSKMSSVTDFHNAVLIANNYTDMFSIK